jgi:hypothetical protein
MRTEDGVPVDTAGLDTFRERKACRNGGELLYTKDKKVAETRVVVNAL